MNKDVLNIYDIAEIAKVSIATVSRVVNGSDKVSEATRQKVLKVIEHPQHSVRKGLTSWARRFFSETSTLWT